MSLREIKWSLVAEAADLTAAKDRGYRSTADARVKKGCEDWLENSGSRGMIG